MVYSDSEYLPNPSRATVLKRLRNYHNIQWSGLYLRVHVNTYVLIISLSRDRVPPPLMDEYGRALCVRGYHVYREIWAAAVGQASFFEK